VKIFEYYSRYERIRGGFGRLPGWARLIVMVFALPGVVALGLSLLAAGVSILALFLLTTPVYRCLKWLTGAGEAAVGREKVPAEGEIEVTSVSAADVEPPADPEPDVRPRRQIDVRIIE
jgi:hypothetical protein